MYKRVQTFSKSMVMKTEHVWSHQSRDNVNREIYLNTNFNKIPLPPSLYGMTLGRQIQKTITKQLSIQNLSTVHCQTNLQSIPFNMWIPSNSQSSTGRAKYTFDDGNFRERTPVDGSNLSRHYLTHSCW